MIRRPPRSTQSRSSAASDVYKRQVVHNKDYMESVLPWNQVLAFQHFKKFHGYIGDMFALNNSLDNFFIELQASMDYHPQHESLNFYNIIKLEIARCKMGYSNFESFIREFNQNKALRKELKLSLIHISEPTRLGMISYAVFCLKK